MDLSNLIWQFQSILILVLLLGIILYIYMAIVVRDSAKKLGVAKEWANISWLGSTIPYVMANSAKKHWWPTIVLPIMISVLGIFGGLYNIANILTLILLIIFIGYMIYLKWEICELRGVHGWWALLTPGLFILAIIIVAISESLGIISLILSFLGLVWYLVLWGILAWSK